ncbi:hypothetical protein [Streptomyces sp. NBC_01794]|uniref:hypothetical protein n=1 Tax=Streptomyces sp. NBC_01794 TaxID=2975942 RepID=UPI00387358FD
MSDVRQLVAWGVEPVADADVDDADEGAAAGAAGPDKPADARGANRAAEAVPDGEADAWPDTDADRLGDEEGPSGRTAMLGMLVSLSGSAFSRSLPPEKSPEATAAVPATAIAAATTMSPVFRRRGRRCRAGVRSTETSACGSSPAAGSTTYGSISGTVAGPGSPPPPVPPSSTFRKVT